MAVGVGRARDRVLSGVDGKTQNYCPARVDAKILPRRATG